MREKIEERIQRKEQEIRSLEIQIGEARAYQQAMQDTLRLIPKEASATDPETILKPGSAIAKTVAILKRHGKPMHIGDILRGLGKQDNKKNRVSLAGSLGWYVRKQEIFTRPLPNTFGLSSMEPNIIGQLPDDFGSMEEEGDEDDKPFEEPQFEEGEEGR
jgi:hypothetical protein